MTRHDSPETIDSLINKVGHYFSSRNGNLAFLSVGNYLITAVAVLRGRPAAALLRPALAHDLLDHRPQPVLLLLLASGRRRLQVPLYLEGEGGLLHHLDVFHLAVAKRNGDLPFRTKTNVWGSKMSEYSYSYECSFTAECSLFYRIFGHFNEYLTNFSNLLG